MNIGYTCQMLISMNLFGLKDKFIVGKHKQHSASAFALSTKKCVICKTTFVIFAQSFGAKAFYGILKFYFVAKINISILEKI